MDFFICLFILVLFTFANRNDLHKHFWLGLRAHLTKFILIDAIDDCSHKYHMSTVNSHIYKKYCKYAYILNQFLLRLSSMFSRPIFQVWTVYIVERDEFFLWNSPILLDKSHQDWRIWNFFPPISVAIIQKNG